MKSRLLLPVLFVAILCAPGAMAQVVRPFETDWQAPKNSIDAPVLAALQQKGIQPANTCSDEVFIRRVCVDVIGSLPDAKDVYPFLQDRSPDKRAKLIDLLLARPEFTDYWTLKWCDLLRVKAEFPINLWPNAVQVYYRYVHDAIRDNKPLDQFAREMLTSSGSNFRVGPVNFYRALQGHDGASIARAVALTFMGTRYEKWPEADCAKMAAFFSRVAYKHTEEWKEEIVCLDPAAVTPLDAVLPDGKAAHITPDQDPRQVFADWLLAPGNPWFARNMANRMWSWLMGRGVIQEPDDIRPDNPPSNPELLAVLEKELAGSHYDMRQMFRLILNSRTYQQSSIPRTTDPSADALFAHYLVRRLDAEVLIDALGRIGADSEKYVSMIPEPFTYVPEGSRAITLQDGSISTSLLEMFGRPTRDTGVESERDNQPTDAQRLHLLNSTDVQRKIERSPQLGYMLRTAGGNRQTLIGWIYLALLSRYPTATELQTAGQYFQTPGTAWNDAAYDLAWALINTKEFLYRH